MDTLTHIALGACLGEVIAGNKLGKKALLWGAIAQNIPDVDVIFSLWLSPSANVLVHRGFTHSFFFAGLLSLLLAWLAKRHSLHPGVPLRFWLLFFFLQVGGHSLIDGLNAYGTAWYEPFSHQRVSLHLLFVMDPIFFAPLAAGCIVLLVTKSSNTRRRKIAQTCLLTSVAYLGFVAYQKKKVDKEFVASLSSQEIVATRYFSTPTPFNSLLWYLVATGETGSYVGYRSIFDSPGRVDLQFFPRRDSLMPGADQKDDAIRLKRFAQGHYTLENRGDTLIFNDLRFGQIAGWTNPRADFVFHYYLHPDLDNKKVMQRGRFSGWGPGTTKALFRRIRGIN